MYSKASFNLAACQRARITAKLKPPGPPVTRGHRMPTVWANIELSGNAQPIGQQATLMR